MSSCDQISNEIAALSAAIAALDGKYILKAERSQIVDDGAKKAELLILPAVGLIVTKRLTPLAAQLARLAPIVAKLAPLLNVVGALLQIASLLNGILALIASNRNFDALEQRIRGVERGLENALGQLFQTTNIAREANARSKENALQIQIVTESALRAFQRLEAFVKAEIAFLTSSTLAALTRLQSRIENVEGAAERAMEYGLQGITTGNAARVTAVQGVQDAALAKKTADTATGEARQAQKTAEKARDDAKQALGTATDAIGEARQAQKAAEKARDDAKQALGTATDAIGEARQAQKTAEKAAADALGALALGGAALQAATTVAGGLSNLAEEVNEVEKTADKALSDAEFAKQLNLTEAQKSQRRFDNFVRQNNEDLKIRDLKQSELSKRFDKEFERFKELSKMDSDSRFAAFIAESKAALSGQNNRIFQFRSEGKADLARAKTELNTAQQQANNATQQQQINTNANNIVSLQKQTTANTTDINQLKKNPNVDKQANAKLDQLLLTAALIPARVGDTLRPNLLTPPQVETATGNAICKSANGGCLGNALNNNSNGVKDAVEKAKNDILDKANAAANAAQLALLQKIDLKLGAQIVGGISGKLVDGFKWLKIDRALNVLTLAASIHNGVMLSNDIGQTLAQALNNVLQLIGLKDEKGQAFNVGEAINSSIQGMITAAIGAENYTNLSETWAKANRIYQSTTNVLNSVLNLSQTILQASELIAAYTGRIGNALKKGGVILENAYGWMNPQPKFNRVTQTLEALQNGASTIQMVTQAPLDVTNAVTEFTTASTEFVKAVKEDDKPENKAVAQPEPDKLKADEAAAKTVSQPNPFDFLDLFDGED